MKKSIFCLFILISQILSAGNFEQFVHHLTLVPLKDRQIVADSFINANRVLPYHENDTTVVFIYKSVSDTVKLAGDFTGWMPSMVMKKIEGTDFHYRIEHYETNARIEYKIIDKEWILDPKNPNKFVGGMGVNSEVKMPAYSLPLEISYYPDIPHGTIHDTTINSKNLNNTRKVKIYLPPNYSINNRYPVILIHDGLEYLSLANSDNILDYLIAHNEIEPVIAVFVPPVDRQEEYAGKLKYAFTNFIVDELMPIIDQKYATSKDPGKRANLGASDGGNIALYIGIKHPESFGKVGAQSSDVQTVISQTFKSSSKMNLEFYLDIGKYDLLILIPMVDNLVQILKHKQYTYQFKEWNEGHSWGNWKSHLRFALQQFFPPNNSIPSTEKKH